MSMLYMVTARPSDPLGQLLPKQSSSGVESTDHSFL